MGLTPWPKEKGRNAMSRSWCSGIVAAVALLLYSGGLRAPAQAQGIIAYDVPEGTVGNQAFGGPIGMDFDVNVDVEVTDLGVFDDGSNGLALPITARLYDRVTFAEIARLDFTPGDPGTLAGGSRFKPLSPTLYLPADSRCTIVAEGYGVGEQLGNAGGLNPPQGLTMNPGTCYLFFTGVGRFTGTAGTFPITPNGGSPNCFAAGSFRYVALETPTPRGAIAYVVPAGTLGYQDFGGSVGLDFDVRSGIEVTRLGVFDDGSNGLSRTITARLYDRDRKEQLASLAFTPEDAGTLEGGSRFKALSPSMVLLAGFHGTIVAEGYGPGELLANYIDPIPWSVDDGGCAIVPVGSSRWGAPGVFPEVPDPGPPNRYAAGTFEFKPSSVEPPKPPTGLTATPSDGSVLLSWTAPAGSPPFDGYNVYVTQPGPRRKINTDLVTTTSFPATGLLNGVTHCFELTSAAPKGVESDPTPEVCATPSTSNLPTTRFVAYEVAAGTVGNQDAAVALGLDFQANARILITRLGVFDDGSNNLQSPITARLFDTRTREELASVEFTPADSGVLVGGSRFKQLPLAVELPAGFAATIVTEGYGPAPSERSGNTAIPPLAVGFNSGDCALTALGARVGAAGAPAGTFPVGFDPVNFYAAGTFEYGLRPGEPAPPKDGGIAYVVPEGTSGVQQDFQGSLGLDFNVVSPIRIRSLGVFDDGSDGLSRIITAYVYDRDTQAALASLVFTPDDASTLDGGSRFKNLDTPVLLLQGFRGTIAASGYGPGERNGNRPLNGQGPWSVDTGGCLIAFVGSARYGADPAAFPPSGDAGPPNQYAAGTFVFEPVSPSEVPQPPENLTATGGAGNVTLAWQAPAEGLPPEGYNVYRTRPLPVERVNPVLITATSFTTGSFVNGVTACYFVRTLAANTESAPSNQACYTFPGGTRRPGHYIAYEVPPETLGNTALPGSVGMDFDLDRAVIVTRLGAFDDGGIGFNRTITVRLYDRNTQDELASLSFSPDDPGALIGGSRFQDLATPIRLDAGFQGAIVAEGYGQGEAYGLVPGTWYTERGPCAISFVNAGRTGDEGAFPATPAAGPTNRFAGGTFEFKPVDPPGPYTGGTAYVVPALTAGNQAFEGALGMDFNTNGPVIVTALGVFDDGSNGLSRTITARLYDRDTQEVLASLVFTPEDPGTPEGGSRFKDLVPPLVLAEGFHGSMVAEGYGAGELNGNRVGGLTTQDGGCLLSFVGSGRYSSWPFVRGAFPAVLESGPSNPYAAGTFKFEPGETGKRFIRGDCNGDGQVTGQVTDAVFLLNYNFLGGEVPPCSAACDINADGAWTGQVTDAVYILNYNFLGGPAPPAPFPKCGVSTLESDEALGCATSTADEDCP